MIQPASEFNHRGRPEPSLLRVLEDVASRRRNGELLSDDAVCAAHPELMPQLGELLPAVRMAEGARRMAWASNADARPDALAIPELQNRFERDMFRGYEVGEVIGRGATGIVYHAIQANTGREVAIKVLQQGTFENEREEARFEREAQILAQLKHPNIVTVYDTGWSSGRFYLVMDYVRGVGLDHWLRASSPTLEERLRVFAEIAEATHAAHLRGIIHRDLKPGNIRIDDKGHPHLLDFGLAKVLNTVGGSPSDAPPAYVHSATMTGQFVGSLPWASPEQAEGAPHKIDIRTDIYSIGVMMYQALTGQFPYPVRGNLRDVIDRILTAAPPRMKSLHPAVDDDAETIILTCLQKERERRYQSAGELATDIRHRLAAEPIAARRASGWYVLRSALRRHRIAFAVISGVAALTLLYAATVSVLFRRAAHDAERTKLTLNFLQETLFQASSHRLGSDATMAQVLDDASSRLWNEFAMQPEVATALHYTVGSAYESIWQEEKALQHLRRAVELGRAAAISDTDQIRRLATLGMVLAKSRNPESVSILREALEQCERAPAAYGNLIAEIRGSLAYAHWAAAVPPRWDDAEMLYSQSLAQFAEGSEPETPEMVRIMIGLASMQQARQRTNEAEAQYRKACDRALRFLGPTHQFSLECQIALSDVLVDLAKFDEAQELIDAVSPLAERQFGARIMPTILRRKVYAQIAGREFEVAERTLFDIQAGVCERLAGSMPDESRTLAEMAEVLRTKVGKRGADDAYLAALEMTQRLEPDAMESARALIALGTVRFRHERYAYAERLLRQCLNSLSEIRSPEYSIRSRASRMLSMSLAAQGRSIEAEGVLEDVLAILRDSLGPNESATLQIADDLRTLYMRAGRMKDAEALPTRSQS